MANSEWRMVNENPQLATLNPQPDFGANAPPTCHFYALRITLYALRFQPISGLTPLLPANFTLLRITLPTHNFKDMGQGTRDKTAAISEW
jgi:hypothetical protein